MEQMLAEFQSRCRGAIMGTAFGDALGLPVEGLTSRQIEEQHGVVADFLPHPEGQGRYSDDTQLTLATTISLIRSEGLEAEDCARSCAEHFDPQRGYGRSAMRVLSALANGGDYRTTGNIMFVSGSYGNGAAMRIAPVGLMYGHLPAGRLRALVYEAVRSTHTHDEAIDAAFLIALFVGRLSRLHSSTDFDYTPGLIEFLSYCRDPLMKSKVGLAGELLTADIGDKAAAQQIGCGVRSSESVVLAFYLAMRHLNNTEKAIVQAVRSGGDTDTIAAMAGAVVGARHGDRSFPRRWHAGLERGDGGYDSLVAAADALANTTVKKGFFVDFCM